VVITNHVYISTTVLFVYYGITNRVYITKYLFFVYSTMCILLLF